MITHTAQHVMVVMMVMWGAASMVSAQNNKETLPQDQLGAETSKLAAVDLSVAAASHGGGGGAGGGKFFMYAHQPAKKEYEFGFKRGNDHHTIERYEKGGPHHNFKTKVRWEDSKGGHGEHYWDYNHAPKYHDDHHGDDHHADDHHGGGGDYHDDHHGDHHGGDDHYDDHDDHGGYHSQPVPDYAPAASETATATATALPTTATTDQARGRESTAYQHPPSYRLRRKPNNNNNNNNKAGVEKVTGLDKKKYHFYNEKQTFEYMSSDDLEDAPNEKEESPSVFPSLLDFNPYLPPEEAKEPFFAGDAAAPPSRIRGPHRVTPAVRVAPKTQFSASAPRYSASRPQHPTSTARYQPSTPFGRRSRVRDGSKSTKKEASKAEPAASHPPTPSGLSFDAETGRVYNEGTGKWYSLVPVEEA